MSDYVGNDDDILSDDSVEVTSEPTIVEDAEASTNTREDSFTVGGIAAKDLPDDVRDALRNYTNIHQLEIENTRVNIPGELRLVISMMNFFADMSHYHEDGALIAATAHVVDEITEGRVKLMYRKYEAERTMMYTSIVMKFRDSFEAIVANTEVESHWAEELVAFMETTASVAEYNRKQAVGTYIATCEQLGHEPDEVLIEEGKYGTRSYIHRIGLGLPPGNVDAD